MTVEHIHSNTNICLEEFSPVRFSMDELRMVEIPIPERKWFRFTLEDPATPSFCTCEKDYFGNRDQIMSFLYKRPDLDPALTPCKPLAMARIEFPKTAWEHRNVWDFDYHMEADSITVEQILLHCQDWLALCIRPVFHRLRYYDNICLEWVPVPKMIWGQSHVIEKIGDDFVANLFLLQKRFHTVEEALKEMATPANIRFDSVCDEIFGDG